MSELHKILFVATTAKTHINTFHQPYINFFVDRGWQVDVATNGDALVPNTTNEFKISIHRNPFHPANLKALHQLTSMMRSEKYDMISCHTPMGGVLARLAAWVTHTRRVLYTAHGFHFYQGAPFMNQVIYRTVEQILAPITDAIITINNEDYSAAQRLRLRRQGKAYLIPGVGVNAKKFHDAAGLTTEYRKQFAIEPDAIVVLTVAELNANKNYQTTLQAFAAMRCDNSVYLICGQGEMENELKDMARSLGIGKRVLFLGYRDDIAQIVNMADIFLLASYREGLCVASLEAMTAGKPVVISDNRGSREFAQNGLNSVVCKAGDVQAFTAALNLLSHDKALRARMGEQAKESVRRFSAEKAHAAMFAIYEEWMRIGCPVHV